MDINNFYSFGSEFSKTPVCVVNDNLNFEQANNIVKGNFNKVKLPLLFKYFSGKKWTDILNPSSVGLYVVSEKFVSILEEHSFTGWKKYPILILNKEGKEVGGYVGFSIIGKCGRIDYNKSTIIEKPIIPNAPLSKFYKGIFFALDKWDGTDFFIPDGTVNIFITEKVAIILKKNQITNLRIQNLVEVETPDFAIMK